MAHFIRSLFFEKIVYEEEPKITEVKTMTQPKDLLVHLEKGNRTKEMLNQIGQFIVSESVNSNFNVVQYQQALSQFQTGLVGGGLSSQPAWNFSDRYR